MPQFLQRDIVLNLERARNVRLESMIPYSCLLHAGARAQLPRPPLQGGGGSHVLQPAPLCNINSLRGAARKLPTLLSLLSGSELTETTVNCLHSFVL